MPPDHNHNEGSDMEDTRSGYYVDDVPAVPFTVEPPENIDVTAFTAATAALLVPTIPPTSVALTAELVDDTIEIAQPAESAFTVAGIYRLRIRLTGTGGSQGIPDARFVVQDPDDEWHTLDSIRDEWQDADYIPDVTLWGLLVMAKLQIVEFAPRLEDDVPVPSQYRDAQRIQARNIWNAAKVSPDGGIGTDDFVIRPLPLDWHVKQILRPRPAIGAVL